MCPLATILRASSTDLLTSIKSPLACASDGLGPPLRQLLTSKQGRLDSRYIKPPTASPPAIRSVHFNMAATIAVTFLIVAAVAVPDVDSRKIREYIRDIVHTDAYVYTSVSSSW